MPVTNRPAPRPMPWRFMFWSAIVAAFGSGGVYLTDRLVLEPQRKVERELAEKQKEIERLEGERKKLESFVERLKLTERRAQLYVKDQQTTPDGKVMTTVRFTELDAKGDPSIEYPEFTFEGDELYVDAYTIKFNDDFVMLGDALKGKTLLLFRRIFSNKLQPDAGYELDKHGQAPLAYGAEKSSSAFEKELWQKFWEYPENEELRTKHGVRAAHSTAVSMKVRKEQFLIYEVRVTGEITVTKPTQNHKEPKNPSEGQ